MVDPHGGVPKGLHGATEILCDGAENYIERTRQISKPMHMSLSLGINVKMLSRYKSLMPVTF